MSERIVIYYPPDFDGELHIDCAHGDREYSFAVTQAKSHSTESSWDCLVRIAEAVLAQERRRVATRK